MRRVPLTLLLLLIPIGYAAWLGSEQALRNLEDFFASADRSLLTVVGATSVGFLAGARRSPDPNVALTLDRLVLTGVAIAILYFAWSRRPELSYPCPEDQGPQAIQTSALPELSAPVGTFLPQSLTVRVLDGQGRGLSGQRIRYRRVAGEGNVVFGTRLTDRDGYATNWLRVGPAAGPCEIEAEVLDRPDLTASFHAVGI